MPVTWSRSQRRRALAWSNAALAVGCGSCGATIGEPCGLQIPPGRFHDIRECVAETLGFVAVETEFELR